MVVAAAEGAAALGHAAPAARADAGDDEGDHAAAHETPPPYVDVARAAGACGQSRMARNEADTQMGQKVEAAAQNSAMEEIATALQEKFEIAELTLTIRDTAVTRMPHSPFETAD